MSATLIDCRVCELVQTVTGLCGGCERALEAHHGSPAVELTLYMKDGGPLRGPYDGAGAMLRLHAARREPQYAGFTLRVFKPVPGIPAEAVR